MGRKSSIAVVAGGGQGILFNARVENVPRVMLLIGRAAAAFERFLQDDAFGDLRDIEQPPPDGRFFRRGGCPQLVRQQHRGAVLDPVVVRFDHANAAAVAELNETLAGDCRSQLFVNGLGHGLPTLRCAV